MNRSYLVFLDACKALSPKQALISGVCGGWSAKAVVDHLTSWQVKSLCVMDQLLAHPGVNIDIDIESFNQAAVNERQTHTWIEGLICFQGSFEVFSGSLEGILLLKTQAFTRLKGWVMAMTHEYQGHVTHIQKANND